MNHSDQTNQITAQTEKMLIDQYERLYRLAYSYVHNEADALDVVQESACKAIIQCKKLKDTTKLLPWLCRIVVNTSLDLLRNQIKEQQTARIPAGRRAVSALRRLRGPREFGILYVPSAFIESPG